MRYIKTRVKPTHLQYSCNNCNKTPIIGTRWFCFICRQKTKKYNLCNECKPLVSHPHVLTAIRYGTDHIINPDNDPREPIGYQSQFMPN